MPGIRIGINISGRGAGAGAAPVFSNMSMTNGVAGTSDGALSGEVSISCTAYYDWSLSATPIAAATLKAAAILASQTISLTSGVVTGSLLNTPSTSGTKYLHIVGENGATLGTTTVVTYIVDAAPWYPSMLFGVSDKGAWWDFTDKAYIFTDTSRTTAVTADGDAIKGVTDRSGKGNHISQGTATTWPVYKDTSPTQARGQFDGTDDIITRTYDSAFAMNSVTLAVGFVNRTAHASLDKGLAGAYLTTGNQRAYRLTLKGTSAGGGAVWNTSTNGTANTSIAIGSSLTAGVLLGKATAGAQDVWLNGTASGAALTGTPFYGGTSTAPFNIGADGAGSFGNQGITHIVVIDRVLTTDEQQKLEGYIAWESGLQTSLPGGHPYYSAPPTV